MRPDDEKLHEMSQLVVPTHREFFYRVLLHVWDDPDYQRLTGMIIPVGIMVLHFLHPICPPEDFAEELGAYCVNYFMNHSESIGRGAYRINAPQDIYLSNVTMEFVRQYRDRYPLRR